MTFDISVIVATYNPDPIKLKNTLLSILKQKGVSFEIIICDDGSKADLSQEIRGFFAEYGFSDYKLVRAEANRGTVKNMLAGCNAAQADFVKPISPGDYLYDRYTLKSYCDKFNAENAEIVFGDAQYYYFSDEYIAFARSAPRVNIYKKQVNADKIKKNLLVYNDYILGATLAYEKSAFAEYLEILSRSGILYTEDISQLLFAVDGRKFAYIDGYVIWYESDSGISAPKSKIFSLVQKDQYNFFTDCLVGYKPNKLTEKLSAMHKKSSGKSGLAGALIKLGYFPGKLFFKLKLKFIKPRRKVSAGSDIYTMICQEVTDAN